MPNLVKPVLNLTKEQWARLLERVAKREATGAMLAAKRGLAQLTEPALEPIRPGLRAPARQVPYIEKFAWGRPKWGLRTAEPMITPPSGGPFPGYGRPVGTAPPRVPTELLPERTSEMALEEYLQGGGKLGLTEAEKVPRPPVEEKLSLREFRTLLKEARIREALAQAFRPKGKEKVWKPAGTLKEVAERARPKKSVPGLPVKSSLEDLSREARGRALKRLKKGRGFKKSPPLASEIVSVTPPREIFYGRIGIPVSKEGQELISWVDLPWRGAAKIYAKGGERLGMKLPSTSPPPLDVLRLRQGKSTYERRIWKPIKGSAERARKAVRELEREARKEQTKKVKTRVGQQARKVTKGSAKVSEVYDKALLWDRVWKETIRAKTSLSGQRWTQLMRQSPGGYKMKHPRDFFIRQGLKWMEDPERFAKAHPEIAKELKRAFEVFQGRF